MLARESFALLVDPPENPPLPVTRRGQGPQDLGGNVIERVGGGQGAGDRIARLPVALDAPLLRHVLCRPDQLDRLSVLADDHLAARFEHALLARWPHDPVEVAEGLTTRERSLNQIVHPLAIVPVHAGEEALVGRAPGLRVETEDAIELIGPAECAARNVPFPAADVRKLLRLRQLPLALGYGPLTLARTPVGRQRLRTYVLVEAPGRDACDSRCGHERAMDGSPFPWVRHGIGMVVDTARVEHAHQAVVYDDIGGCEQEGNPILVEREQGDHHEEVEVALDRPTPGVHQQRGGCDQAQRDDHRGESAVAARHRRQYGKHRQRRTVQHGVENAVPTQKREEGERRHVRPENCQQRVVPAKPDVLGQRAAMREQSGDSVPEGWGVSVHVPALLPIALLSALAVPLCRHRRLSL